MLAQVSTEHILSAGLFVTALLLGAIIKWLGQRRPPTI